MATLPVEMNERLLTNAWKASVKVLAEAVWNAMTWAAVYRFVVEHPGHPRGCQGMWVRACVVQEATRPA